jgi:hypothetical protein
VVLLEVTEILVVGDCDVDSVEVLDGYSTPGIIINICQLYNELDTRSFKSSTINIDLVLTSVDGPNPTEASTPFSCTTNSGE